MNDIRNIAFIGAGNMTQSIVGGMCKSGYPADKVWVSNPSDAKLEKMKSQLGVNTSNDNLEVVNNADAIVLSVKPQLMAEVCAKALLSQLKSACSGDLDKVKRVVKLGGFVASSPNFIDHPKIINGASNLIVKIFEDKGKHSRFAVGVASLPLNAPVEIEGVFEIEN